MKCIIADDKQTRDERYQDAYAALTEQIRAHNAIMRSPAAGAGERLASSALVSAKFREYEKSLQDTKSSYI